MVNWTAAGAMLLVLILQEPAKDFGTPYTIKVQAKTRWSNSFKKEDFDREFKRFADKLRERARAAVTEDQSGWDEWTFDAAETWKCDLGVFERIFGKHIVIRRYDIEIVGTVKIDVKAGHEKFRVSGEVVKSPANSILLDGAEALPKQEKK
jgi:hypothetical protein